MVNDCIFCRIKDGMLESKRVHADSLCYAIEDVSPQAPTHILVIPNQHIASLEEVQEEHEPVLGRLLGVAAELARDRGLESYRTVINTGPGAGQSIFHIHLHLLGGRTMTWPPG